MIGNNYILWENDELIVKTPYNPHLAYSEGLHIVVAPKADYSSAWDDSAVTGATFTLAAKVSKIAHDIGLAPWLNLQANGNWGLLPDATPFFHVHVYGRNKTASWGKPVTLPELPGTYQNNPMPEADRKRLAEALSATL